MSIIKTKTKEELVQIVEESIKNLVTLNTTLRKQLIDTRLVTIEQWNDEIAPKLSALSMSLEGVNITAKTFRLPTNYFE